MEAGPGTGQSAGKSTPLTLPRLVTISVPVPAEVNVVIYFSLQQPQTEGHHLSICHFKSLASSSKSSSTNIVNTKKIATAPDTITVSVGIRFVHHPGTKCLLAFKSGFERVLLQPFFLNHSPAGPLHQGSGLGLETASSSPQLQRPPCLQHKPERRRQQQSREHNDHLNLHQSNLKLTTSSRVTSRTSLQIT